MLEIEKLYKNPDYLIEKSSVIFEEARRWVNENTNIVSVLICNNGRG